MLFAGSSWYWYRYMDPHNKERFAGKEAIDYWQDVDLYIGGSEHAVGHLLYSRFWNHFLYDLGVVPKKEYAKKLINQGMIQGVIEFLKLQKEKVNGNSRFVCADIATKEEADGVEFAQIPIHVDCVKDYGTDKSYVDLDSVKKFLDWRPEYKDAIFECGNGIYQSGVFTPRSDAEQGSHLMTVSEVGKMSKRYFNVVNPDDVVARYRADCFRMFEMFLGPIEQAMPWNTTSVSGTSRFPNSFWRLFFRDER